MALTTFNVNPATLTLPLNPLGGKPKTLAHMKPQRVTYNQNGYTQDVTNTLCGLQVGVPVTAPYMFKVIPAPLSSNCVSPLNAWNSAGQTLNSLAQGTAPNITARPITINNQTGVMLDCERCLSITQQTGGPTFLATTITVTGYVSADGNLQPITFSQSLAGSLASPFVLSTPILVVMSVKFSNTFGTTTVSIGNSNKIGLPYLLTSTSYVLATTYNQLSLASSVYQVGNNWRVSTPTATNAVCRGYITTPSDTDGIKELTACYIVQGSDSELNNQMYNKNQSALKIGNVQKNTSSSYPKANFVLPGTTKYDLRGVIYPADNTFIRTYTASVAS